MLCHLAPRAGPAGSPGPQGLRDLDLVLGTPCLGMGLGDLLPLTLRVVCVAKESPSTSAKVSDRKLSSPQHGAERAVLRAASLMEPGAWV